MMLCQFLVLTWCTMHTKNQYDREKPEIVSWAQKEYVQLTQTHYGFLERTVSRLLCGCIQELLVQELADLEKVFYKNWHDIIYSSLNVRIVFASWPSRSKSCMARLPVMFRYRSTRMPFFGVQLKPRSLCPHHTMMRCSHSFSHSRRKWLLQIPKGSLISKNLTQQPYILLMHSELGYWESECLCLGLFFVSVALYGMVYKYWYFGPAQRLYRRRSWNCQIWQNKSQSDWGESAW